MSKVDKLTKVVSVKVNDIRPKYDNLKEWMDDDDNVYIGRRGIVFIDGKRFPPNDSIWANPFKIDHLTTRYMAINQYRRYIIKKLDNGDIPYEELLKLKGKKLGCWCKTNDYIPCHGDVLIELLENYKCN
jgi:hypothetical protein